jgi:multiple sugar transport system substrate-binding protein
VKTTPRSSPASPRSRSRRLLTAAIAIACTVTAGTAACSASGSGSSAASSGTYTVWDPYPQFTNGSAWVRLLNKCGSGAGVEIKRTAFDTTDLTSKELLAAQQGVSPDVLIVDNPVVSTLAEAGVLTTTAQNGISTSAIESNLMGAGEYQGKTYGIPIGANTLALYYNKKILDEAGADPTTITNWTSLTAALAKVKAIGTVGIHHYIGNNDQQWNAIMATAVVASIPATILLVIAQRYVSAGVTAGAVKD